MVSQEMAEFLAHNCAGAKCEVMTERNPLLIIGVFASYRRDVSQVQINVRGRGSVPQGIIYHSPMWVRVRIASRGFVMISGRVTRVGPDFYRIEVLDAVFNEERREYFRQHLTGTATLRPANGDSPSMCELVDVSLNGIAFKSGSEYPIGSYLTLSDVQIIANTQPYTFHCLVRRISCEDGSGQFVHGCSLLNLTERERDRLARDIFILQAEEIRRVSQPQ